jgi:hypothetical protein
MSQGKQGFRGVPGVPDGWELVHCLRIGEPGEFGLNQLGQPFAIGPSRTINKIPIIRKVKESKIEQPEKYRPFANAAEFKPHRDRWVTRTDISDDEAQPGACRVGEYDDQGVWWNSTEYQTWKASFDAGRCFDDDGTPFGVKVEE